MRKGNWKLVMLRNFSGGLVSRPKPHQLSEGQWHDLQNVRLGEAGGFDKRGGSNKINSQILVRFE